MIILLVNDDGYASEGILALARVFSKQNDVYIVAPDKNMSATGQSLTIHEPIIIKQHENSDLKGYYSVCGTPVDCVKFALLKLKIEPDVIISGINCGSNLGTDVPYSGTIGAALEGAIMNYKAIAISTVDKDNPKYDYCAKYLFDNIDRFMEHLNCDNVLSINVPPVNEEDVKGEAYCQLGYTKYTDEYVEVKPNTFVLTGQPLCDKRSEKNSDVILSKQGYVTVTPLHRNLTNFSVLKKLL